MQEAGISVKDVSVRTVSRFLNSQGYYYLQARKKGVLTVTDMKKRLQFARRMRKHYGADVWTKRIAFYLDCVSYVYKRNPLDQALAPKARIWRKRGEGLTTGCLAKGKKEGTGGRYVRLIVAISYDKGIIACYPYTKMTGRLLRILSMIISRECFCRQIRGERTYLYKTIVHVRIPCWLKQP